MRTRFCETIFWGFKFRKTETNFSFFKKGFLDLVSAPQEGSGEECGADSFLDFWRAGIKKKQN
jgi:hypothetical protein